MGKRPEGARVSELSWYSTYNEYKITNEYMNDYHTVV